MAREKSSRPAKKAVCGLGRGGRSWSPTMYLNPGGHTPGFDFAVHRRRFRGAPNISATELVRRKLYPVDAPPEGCWDRPFTCLRYDVLLPPEGGIDAYMDARLLLTIFEAHLPPFRQGLATVIKVAQSVDRPLQASYEEIRAATRQIFPLKRRLPAILIAHAPFRTGASIEHRRPHCHVIALTAELPGILGFAGTNDEITSDAGHLVLYEEYLAAGAIT